MNAGEHLGPYEIVAPLGHGGMGEVYRAKDTKLGRDVAIKVLPEAVAADPERVARFEREAKVLASLNHPHIAHIYGLEKQAGRHDVAIVMELVDGQTLAERLGSAADRLPLEDALSIALQIAGALEAAHEQGIVHRDLKPANVKIRPDGTVKVLDFGLAKMIESGADRMRSAGPESPAYMASHSPTLSVHATLAGVILGTAAYMSPEQARGKPVDRRADIWAFGCVLFEMVTGRQTFDAGETVSDAVASILKNDPDWSALPAGTPPHIRTLLRRCLQKDPQRRLPHIGLVRLELEESRAEDSAPSVEANLQARLRRPTSLWKRALPAAMAAILAAALVGATMWWLRPAPPAPAVLRFSFTSGAPFLDMALPLVAVAPDGARIAYAANGRLYVRTLSEPAAKEVTGSEFAQGYAGDPVFSPDGQSLAYWTGSGGAATLKRLAITGGTPVVICQALFPFGTTWDSDGIVFGQGGFNQFTNGVLRVSPNGGTPVPLVTINKNEVALAPQVLPGGEAVLFTLATGIDGLSSLIPKRWDEAQVVVQTLRTGERKMLVKGGSAARYLPTGHLAYMVGSTLFAAPFDAKRLELTGAVVPVVEGVSRTGVAGSILGGAQLHVSAAGVLVYIPESIAATSPMGLALIERRTGVVNKLNVAPGAYEFPRVSRDGKRIAVGVSDSNANGNVNIWIYDLAGDTALRQLTFGRNNRYPVWSPDGARIVFQSDREADGGIFWQRADGSAPAERLTKPEPGNAHIPVSWSPDGNTLLVDTIEPTARRLYTLSLPDGKMNAFGGITTNVVFALAAAFSPDGRWIAYTSTSGPAAPDVQALVQPFPATGARYLAGTGIHPFWSADGRELLFFRPSPSGTALAAMQVNTQGGFTLGNPQPVAGAFRTRGPFLEREIDTTPDGRFFVAIVDTAAPQSRPATPPINVVVNWFEEIRSKVKSGEVESGK